MIPTETDKARWKFIPRRRKPPILPHFGVSANEMGEMLDRAARGGRNEPFATPWYASQIASGSIIPPRETRAERSIRRTAIGVMVAILLGAAAMGLSFMWGR